MFGSAHAPTRPAAHARPGAGPHAARPIPPFTAEHERFRGEVRRFVGTELAPHATEWEEARWFPSAVFERLAELGYIGLKFPHEFGGSDDPLADAVFVEELARCGSGGLAAGIGAHSGIALPPIWKFGTSEQKERYLLPGIQGQRIAALGITEPDAGSDVASLRTRARAMNGGYVVNGSKTFITGGVRADFIVTAVRTGDAAGHGAISFLIIDRGEGVRATPLEKLGWHASDTAVITFDDVHVPAENLLGPENGGFYLIMANFQWERLLMALGAVGAMQVALEHTVEGVRARGCGQATRHELADIATTVESGRAVTYGALRRYVAGEDAVREVTMAKLFTQRGALEAIDRCLRIHGLRPDAGACVVRCPAGTDWRWNR